MTKECVHLFLVVDVPYSHKSILATRHQVLAIRGDSCTKYLVIVTFESAVKLLASEEKLFLRLQVPLKHQK